MEEITFRGADGGPGQQKKKNPTCLVQKSKKIRKLSYDGSIEDGLDFK